MSEHYWEDNSYIMKIYSLFVNNTYVLRKNIYLEQPMHIYNTSTTIAIWS